MKTAPRWFIDLLSEQEILELYKHFSGVRTVAKFPDRQTAEIRLLNCVWGKTRAAMLEAFTTVGLSQETARQYGEGLRSPLAFPQGGMTEADMRKHAKVLQADQKSGAKQPKKEKVAGAASGPGVPGPRSDYAGKRLYRLTDKNPRREGTHGYNSFALVRDGMTYEEYRAAGGRNNDLAWDLERKFIELRGGDNGKPETETSGSKEAEAGQQQQAASGADSVPAGPQRPVSAGQAGAGSGGVKTAQRRVLRKRVQVRGKSKHTRRAKANPA